MPFRDQSDLELTRPVALKNVFPNQSSLSNVYVYHFLRVSMAIHSYPRICRLLILIIPCLLILKLLNIFSDVQETIERRNRQDIPSHPQQFQIYDDSTKKALHNLRLWIDQNSFPLPLFPNRLLTNETGNLERVCVAVSTVVRPKAGFAYLIRSVTAYHPCYGANAFASQTR
jgi:hypothetical protein